MLKRLIFATMLVVLPAVASDVIERSFAVSSDCLLDLSNVSGAIEISVGSSSKMEIRAVSEDSRIDVEFSQEGNRVYVKTRYPESNRSIRGGVSFTVTLPERSNLQINSVSGSINVSGVSGNHDLNSVSGRVDVSNLEGRLVLNSVSGTVNLKDIGVADVNASSISGSLTYRGDLAGGPYRLSSTSGSIDIEHSSRASYHVEGSTVSGSISSSVDGVQVTKQKYGPMKELSGQFNGNGTSLRVSTVSGSIEIRQR